MARVDRTRARAFFHGIVSYVAHNVDGAEQVPFWTRLDAIGVTLYPSLVADNKLGEWARVMRKTDARLKALSNRANCPVFVAEIGLRSAAGPAAKPWESGKERAADVDERLQSGCLAHVARVAEGTARANGAGLALD